MWPGVLADFPDRWATYLAALQLLALIGATVTIAREALNAAPHLHRAIIGALAFWIESGLSGACWP
jgi:hypothetical protein